MEGRESMLTPVHLFGVALSSWTLRDQKRRRDMRIGRCNGIGSGDMAKKYARAPPPTVLLTVLSSSCHPSTSTSRKTMDRPFWGIRTYRPDHVGVLYVVACDACSRDIHPSATICIDTNLHYRAVGVSMKASRLCLLPKDKRHPCCYGAWSNVVRDVDVPPPNLATNFTSTRQALPVDHPLHQSRFHFPATGRRYRVRRVRLPNGADVNDG